MAWTNLTFLTGSKLTATKMTQFFANLTALANGDSGAPPLLLPFDSGDAGKLSKVKSSENGVEAVTFDSGDAGLPLVVESSEKGVAVLPFSPFRGMLAGLPLSNNAGDANNDIDIGVGVCRDGGDAYMLGLAAVMGKQLDAVWVTGGTPGATVGGRFSAAAKAADTTYWLFLIRKDSDGSIDAGFDTSPIAANIPAGYTAFRILGGVITDGSSNILGFTQKGDDFLLDAPLADYSDNTATAAAKTAPLTVPTGRQVWVNASLQLFANAGGDVYYIATSFDQDDTLPTTTRHDMYVHSTDSPANNMNKKIRTNTDGEIRLRVDVANAGIFTRVTTHGWTDRRGKDD